MLGFKGTRREKCESIINENAKMNVWPHKKGWDSK